MDTHTGIVVNMIEAGILDSAGVIMESVRAAV